MEQTPTYLKSLKKESVVQSVINCLTDAMRNKELQPGQRIPPEPELAASLGVARSSVREAIKILTYLGVLESKRSEGTFVCSGFKESMIDPMIYGIILNQDSFEDLMDLRQMIEVGSMRLAILKHTDEELEDLSDILEQMHGILVYGNNKVDDFFRIDNDFHDKVTEMSHNPLVDKINRVVRTLTYSMRYETVRTMITTGHEQELYEAHADLFAALSNAENIMNMDEIVRKTYFSEVFTEVHTNE